MSTAAEPVVTTSKPGPQPSDFKLFKPTSRSPAKLEALPDEYFTPTAADLKEAQSALSARTQALVNAPLQTRAIRDAQVKAKHDRWPETRIRIKFLDQTQLEKSFPSTNKIKPVYAFVRSCLLEDVKPIKFVLYQPPKRELKVSDPAVRDLTLADLQLAPSSILLVRFEDDSLNHVNVPAPLSADVMSQAVELPLPVPVAPAADTKSTPKPSANSGSSKPSNASKMQKFFKIGQKK